MENLKERLESFRIKRRKDIPELIQRKLDIITSNLQNSGQLESCLRTGDVAPDFCLLNQHNKPVKLSTLLHSGNVIINFFRGSWCK